MSSQDSTISEREVAQEMIAKLIDEKTSDTMLQGESEEEKEDDPKLSDILDSVTRECISAAVANIEVNIDSENKNCSKVLLDLSMIRADIKGISAIPKKIFQTYSAAIHKRVKKKLQGEISCAVEPPTVFFTGIVLSECELDSLLLSKFVSALIEIQEEYPESLEAFKKIIHLDISMNQLDDDAIYNSLPNLLELLPSLAILDLCSNNITDDGATIIGSAIKGKNITKLDLQCCPNITTAGACKIIESLSFQRKSKYLPVLNFGELHGLNDTSCMKISAAILSGNLRGIILYNDAVTDDGARALFKAVVTSPDLVEFEFSSNSMTNGSLYALAEEFNSGRKLLNSLNMQGDLGSLVIRSAWFGDEGVSRVVRSLSLDSRMEYIDISGNDLTNISAGLLITTCYRSKYLRSINLGTPHISKQASKLMRIAGKLKHGKRSIVEDTQTYASLKEDVQVARRKLWSCSIFAVLLGFGLGWMASSKGRLH